MVAVVAKSRVLVLQRRRRLLDPPQRRHRRQVIESVARRGRRPVGVLVEALRPNHRPKRVLWKLSKNDL